MMDYLGVPVQANTDNARLKRLLKNSLWEPHGGPWAAAYEAYREHRGNPWLIEPCEFETDLTQQQADLYKNRAQHAPINDIRRMPGLKCCPVCGSKTAGSVDHYLPKGTYGEFAIMVANLVPACSMCNSGVKGEVVKGEVAPARFIHPYFDEFAAQALWLVRIVPPFTAALFKPEPLVSLSADKTPIVAFHLENVLGWHFDTEMRTQWGNLPRLLRRKDPDAAPRSLVEVLNLLQTQLEFSEITEGLNGWRTAFYRGVLDDEDCVRFLRDAAASPE